MSKPVFLTDLYYGEERLCKVEASTKSHHFRAAAVPPAIVVCGDRLTFIRLANGAEEVAPPDLEYREVPGI